LIPNIRYASLDKKGKIKDSIIIIHEYFTDPMKITSASHKYYRLDKNKQKDYAVYLYMK
jgi:hypothetical protein